MAAQSCCADAFAVLVYTYHIIHIRPLALPACAHPIHTFAAVGPHSRVAVEQQAAPLLTAGKAGTAWQLRRPSTSSELPATGAGAGQACRPGSASISPLVLETSTKLPALLVAAAASSDLSTSCAEQPRACSCSQQHIGAAASGSHCDRRELD